ncbi:hypothetical protein ILUMI_10244 [Ignelater luminosus]|uniref:Major facilitator superfamily (MFS) profile domain-containing protein n=1 Tax=Ignelater luminosus TaxID=2038154 RepID=A0A8K0D7I4_IGNLU|nr:hypothetical protein ILUMI_10244 [Ignelater luminosus]
MLTTFSGSELFSGRFSQVIAVLSATANCLSGGMQYGWTAPVVPILESPDSPVKIEKSDIMWIENCYMLGALAGIPFTIYSLNKFGRKYSILISAVQNLISWILTAFATSIGVLYTARAIQGFSCNSIFVCAPMYIAEIADKKIRGFLGAWVYLMMLIGIALVYAVAPFMSIPMSSLIGAIFVIIQLVTFPFMPETPYYLLLQDKVDDAIKSLQRLRPSDKVEAEMKEITAAVERQRSERGRIIDLFTVDSNQKAMVIMTVLNVTQHLSGISVMIMNLHTILADAASMLSPKTAAIIFSVIMLVAATVSSSMMDKMGRKMILSISSFITAISLISLAIYFSVKNSGIDVSSYSWVPVVAVMVYAAAFKCGLGIVPIVMTGELFPTSVKTMGVTFADAVYCSFSVISVYLYKFLTDTYGTHVPFIIFAIICLLATVFITYYIPETKGKTLEEIQFILKDKRRKNDEKTSSVDV